MPRWRRRWKYPCSNGTEACGPKPGGRRSVQAGAAGRTAGRSFSVALTCPRCVQKVRVKLRKCLGENGRHVGTRTPDLYRVNYAVQTLKPSSFLAFLHPSISGINPKIPGFGDELVTSS